MPMSVPGARIAQDPVPALTAALSRLSLSLSSLPSYPHSSEFPFEAGTGSVLTFNDDAPLVMCSDGISCCSGTECTLCSENCSQPLRLNFEGFQII